MTAATELVEKANIRVNTKEKNVSSQWSDMEITIILFMLITV